MSSDAQKAIQVHPRRQTTLSPEEEQLGGRYSLLLVRCDDILAPDHEK
jgi:hypothetical protein